MANDKRISALTERTSFSANDYMVLDNAGEGESKKFLASMFTDQLRGMQNILGSKNLLPNKLSTYAENGLTITINADKSITINGTSSADTTVKITQRYNNSGNKMTLQNGDYILSGCTGGNSSSYRMQAIVLKSAAETVLATNYNGNSLFTVNGDDGSASSAEVQISIFVPSGKTLSSKTFYPMVRPASILDNTYIPHAETNAQLTDDVAALNSALSNKADASDVTPIGTIVNGTNYGESPGNGQTGTGSIISLGKGKWLLTASGYNPLGAIAITNQATSASFQKYTNENYIDLGISSSLSYRFNICGIVNLTANITRIDLRITNWEGSTKQIDTTKFTVMAIRIK